MYMYISNTDSRTLHPQNTGSNFIVQLPQYIDLSDGVWTCGVIQCTLPTRPTEPVYISGDFVEPSVLGGRFQSVLAMTSVKSKDFQHITYVHVKRTQISTLHMKFVNAVGLEVNLSDGDTYIVLQFQKQQ